MNALINNLTPFIPDNYSKLCLLDTDIIEPKLLVRNIADAVYKEYPECFQGEETLVFFRLRYTPPYEKFTELKRLILQIRQATGIRSEKAEAAEIVGAYEEDIDKLRNNLNEMSLLMQGLKVENQRLRSHLNKGE